MSSPLRIAFYSYAFYPSVGGIESVSVTLATEFSRMGHEVKLITRTSLGSNKEGDFPFEVIRKPTPAQLWATVGWCDVYFQNNISLPALWPLFLLQKPWVVAHQTWLRGVDGRVDFSAKLKLWATHLAAASISISEAVARQFTTPQKIIGNPYDANLFRKAEGVSPQQDLIFVGRLVSDKGVGDLLGALDLLQKKNLRPRLTVVGDGPDRFELETQARALGVGEQVRFVGVQQGEALVSLLQAHRVLVVPSRWEEPYGIVALEGLACGCLVVGSERGGLKDAIGPGGLTFPNGDVTALAAALETSLAGLALPAKLAVEAHLIRQSPAAVAEAYLEVFQGVARQV